MEESSTVVSEDNENNEVLGKLLQTLDQHIENAVTRHNGTFVEIQRFASGKVGCRVMADNLETASQLFEETEQYLAPLIQDWEMEQSAKEEIKEMRRLTTSAAVSRKNGYAGHRPTSRNGRNVK